MSQKKKLTLTIEGGLIESAKAVASRKGESLSSIVERFLRDLSTDGEQGDWIEQFHRKYLPEDYQRPSREDIKKLFDDRVKKFL